MSVAGAAAGEAHAPAAGAAEGRARSSSARGEVAGARAAPSDALIEVDGLRFAYPRHASAVLSIERFVLAPGESVFLHGESGSGKSTLLALLAGVLLPQAGGVRLLGAQWAALPPARRDRRRADHVGLVFQQFNLLGYLPVIDNVLLPCRFSARRAERAAASDGSPRRAAERLLARTGLPAALWTRAASTLSVGQQQRVAAARALLGAPELVIADEPTSALDEARRDDFMALLKEACAQAGSALVFVSHDARLAAGFARRVDLAAINAVASPR